MLSIPAERADDVLRAAAGIAEREAAFFPIFSRPDFKVALLREWYRDALPPRSRSGRAPGSTGSPTPGAGRAGTPRHSAPGAFMSASSESGR